MAIGSLVGALPTRHQHPRNKDLIAHFKSKGDSVSWGIAESIEKYEEDTKKKVSWGTDIAALYDQETECELAKEVENRINKALIDMEDPWADACLLIDDDDDDGEEWDLLRPTRSRVVPLIAF